MRAEENRVLVVAPFGQDAQAMAQLLRAQGVTAEACAGPGQCLEYLEAGAGALLLTEEALELPAAEDLLQTFQRQPAWSELPLIILTSGGESRFERLLELAAQLAGAITVLERPMAAGTLLRTVQVALGSRRRQYKVRDLMAELERRQAALRRSEARLTQAVRVGGVGTFEHEHQSDRLEFSAVLRELLGFRQEEEVTLSAFLNKVLPEDREGLVEAIRRAHDPAGGGAFETDYRAAVADREIRWLSVRSQTFFVGEGSERRPERTIGAVVDVTERKDRQAELERLVAERTAKLQELVGELEHFSYTITHDMKSPLRAMRGFAEIAAMAYADCGRPEAQDALAKISSAAERMECLITDALSYSRSVRQELPLTDVDVGALLRGMLDSYPELQPSRADIRVEGELPVVLGNEAGLTQCLSNLLGNAVKFVRPGQVPEVRVWAEALHSQPSTLNSLPQQWVRIWVADQGIGISRQMLPRVFDMFSRGSKDCEGTGIGLALVRKVVQRMGGRLGVESEEGLGSRFWIELKLGEARSRARRAEAARSEAQAGLVLYVEDEESDAMFMEMAFAKAGLATALRVVRDGRAAIEYLSGAGKYGDRRDYPLPSVVLLDLNLPQVPGFEVLRWMRNHPDFARTPVVIFSSSRREDDRMKAREFGANDFVTKPSSGMEFGRVVEGLRETWMSGRRR